MSDTDFVNVSNNVAEATMPAVAEPAVAEPVVDEPAVAEPAVAEPVVAEPVVAEPVVAEPVVAEPAVVEPVEAEPEVQENDVDALSAQIEAAMAVDLGPAVEETPVETMPEPVPEVVAEATPVVFETPVSLNQESAEPVVTKKVMTEGVDINKLIASVECTFTRKIVSLLLWQCPRTTGVAFAVGMGLWYLLQLKGYSVMTLSSYATMLLVVSNFMFVRLHPLLVFFKFADASQDPHTMVLGAGASPLNADALSTTVRDAVNALNNMYTSLGQDILLCRDAKTSLLALVALYFTAVLGRCISLPSTMFLAFALAFTAPRAYLSNKAAVDGVLAVAHAKAVEGLQQAKTAAQPALDAAQPYLAKVTALMGNTAAADSKKQL